MRRDRASSWRFTTSNDIFIDRIVRFTRAAPNIASPNSTHRNGREPSAAGREISLYSRNPFFPSPVWSENADPLRRLRIRVCVSGCVCVCVGSPWKEWSGLFNIEPRCACWTVTSIRNIIKSLDKRAGHLIRDNGTRKRLPVDENFKNNARLVINAFVAKNHWPYFNGDLDQSKKSYFGKISISLSPPPSLSLSLSLSLTNHHLQISDTPFVFELLFAAISLNIALIRY
jgi:hypothetical protein